MRRTAALIFSLFLLLFGAGAVTTPSLVQATDEPTLESTATIEQTTSEQTEDVVELHYFDDPLCSVCAQQKEYMEQLEQEYDNLVISKYDISDTARFRALAEERGITDYRIMAPSTFIGNELLQFSSFGEREEQALIAAIEGKTTESTSVLRLPIINREIDMSTWSLPILAILLGTLDGFNVCSLGALILILSIVLTLDSRKKIVLYGGLFILTTVLVYGGLVFIWGQVIDMFIGQLQILRLLVGLAALAGSAWFFKEFWRFYKYGPSCKTSDMKIAKKSSQKLIDTFNEPSKGPLMLAGGIIMFAIVITIVELPCSIGVPIAFTGILVESGVSLGMYTLYILLYLLFYMLIELIIFTGAVMTKEIWFAGSKFITWTTLAGALILLSLAAYYLLSLIN